MADVEVVKFIADDLHQMFPELKDKPTAQGWAYFNQTAGPAFTGFLDKSPIICGGLRIFGVAEAWAYVSPKLQSDRLSARITILRQMLERFEELQREHNLWRIWADINKGDGINVASEMQREDLLRFLGFKKNETAYMK